MMPSHDRAKEVETQDSAPPTVEPRKMLTEAELLLLLPFGRTTLHAMIKQGLFPRGVNVSPNRKAWFSTRIVDWQNAIEASNPHHNPARGRGKGRRPRMSVVKGS